MGVTADAYDHERIREEPYTDGITALRGVLPGLGDGHAGRHRKHTIEGMAMGAP